MEFLWIFLITIIPITLWGVYFHYKNPRRKPLGEIARIFSAGMLSIVPVFIFHQYFLEPAADRLALAIHVADLPIATSLIKLVLVVIFISFFMAVFALIQSGVQRLILRVPEWQRFHALYKKLYHLSPLLAFFAIFLVIEIFFGLTRKTGFIFSAVGSVIVFAVVEEYFKYIITPFLTYKKLTSIGSAVVDALFIGLAFAFVENILFFIQAKGGDNFMTIYIYRSVFTTLLHVCSSGILGYFYGLSLFSGAILTNYEIEKAQYDQLSSLRKFLGARKKSIFQSISITHGFFVAALVHALFNLLVFMGLKVIAGILIVGLALFIVYLLGREKTQTQYGLIGTEDLTVEDWKNLKLKTSVLRDLKEIKEEQKQ